MADKARRILIRTGKMLPFAMCAILLIAYGEDLMALVRKDYVVYGDFTTLNTPVSYWIASKFEYDFLTIVVTLIISLSIEACIYNRLAIAYLAANLWFKQYIFNVELEEITIAVSCIIHCIIAAFLVYKGVRILLK